MTTPNLTQSPAKVIASLTARSLAYAVIFGAIFFFLMFCGAYGIPMEFFGENGPVEVSQAVFALSTALLFLLAGRLDSARQPCAVIVAAFVYCLVIREFDYFFDEFFPRHAWKVGVTVVLVFLAGYTARFFREIGASLAGFISLPCSGILFSGMLVLLVFSRLFGYGNFWEALFCDENCQIVRQIVAAETDNPVYVQLLDEKCLTITRIVEETAEQIGYLLMLISSCEYLHDARTRRRIELVPKECETV